jgi:cell division septation protein DedD
MRLWGSTAWAQAACLFLLVSMAPGFDAEPLLQHARDREKAGDLEASAALLRTWLETNPGATGSAPVFAAYVRTESDLRVLLDTGKRYLVSAKGAPGAASQFQKIARLFDLAGRIEDARNAYLAAYAEGAPDSALISAFLLSYQMNDVESMAAALQKMPGKGGSADLLLRALSDIRGGDRASARTALTTVADQTGNPDLALKALWILYNVDTNGGNPAAAALSRARLTSRFASAPETAIAAGPAGAKTARAVVQEMPTPLVPVDAVAPPAGGAAPAESTAPQAGPPAAAPQPAAQATPQALAVPAQPVTPQPALQAAPPATVSVQAGSFLMKENADDLVTELTKRGFAPVVLHETTQGRDRYRVLAGAGLETEAARSILRKLSEAGFGGFIVADK